MGSLEVVGQYISTGYAALFGSTGNNTIDPDKNNRRSPYDFEVVLLDADDNPIENLTIGNTCGTDVSGATNT